MAHIATTSSQLAEFIAHQRQINVKLDCLPEILKTLKDHSDRLVSLERAVAQHPSASASSVALSGSDLTVSGIPAMIQDEPGLVVEKVFVALGLQNLLSHVLSVRGVGYAYVRIAANLLFTSILLMTSPNWLDYLHLQLYQTLLRYQM